MASRKIRQIIGRIGGTALDTALTLVVIYATPWLQANSPYMLYGAVSLVVLAILSGGLWMSTNDPEEGKPASTPATAFRLSGAPSTIIASSTDNVVNVYQAAPAPATLHTPPEPVLKPSTDSRTPQLTLKIGMGTIEEDGARFEFPEVGGQKALVLELINNPASSEGEAYPARKIAGRLTLMCADKTLYIDRTFWIGKDENEINLPVGANAFLLLGVLHGTQWTLYQNLNLVPRDLKGWDTEPHDPVPNAFPDMGMRSLVVEVYILSFADHTASRTLAHGRVDIDYTDELPLPQLRARITRL